MTFTQVLKAFWFSLKSTCLKEVIAVKTDAAIVRMGLKKADCRLKK